MSDSLLNTDVLTRIVAGAIKLAKRDHPDADTGSMAKRVVGVVRGYFMDKSVALADDAVKERIRLLTKEIEYHKTKNAKLCEQVRDLLGRLEIKLTTQKKEHVCQPQQ